MNSSLPVTVKRMNAGSGDVRVHLDALRRQLSPRGDVVSEAGRQKTIEVFGEPLTPVEVVRQICEDVRQCGAEAVLEYWPATRWRRTVCGSAASQRRQNWSRPITPRIPSCWRRSARSARTCEFQRAILHRDVQIERPEGVVLRQRYRPIPRAGLCVPGGAAAYPSTVLMTAVPAQVAGVRELAVVAPPTRSGRTTPMYWPPATSWESARSTGLGAPRRSPPWPTGPNGMPPVDKIVGPGNLFVAWPRSTSTATSTSIRSPAPARWSSSPTVRRPARLRAADLIAQAEHAPGASILVTWDSELLEATERELARQVAHLSRAELTVDSLESFGALSPLP